MAYDVSKMADWQIAEAAEEKMPTPDEWRSRLGLEKDEILPYGRVAKLDFLKIMERLKNKPDGKYIVVTAVTLEGGAYRVGFLVPLSTTRQPASDGMV